MTPIDIFRRLRDLPPYLRCLLELIALGFVGRIIFTLFHPFITHQLSLGGVVHALLWGLRFDLAIAAFLALLAYLIAYLAKRLLRWDYATVLRRVTYVAVVFLVLLQGADLMYFSNTGRHLAYEALDAINDASALLGTAISLYWRSLLAELGLMAAALWLTHVWLGPSNPHWSGVPQPPAERGWRRVKPELALVAILLASVIMIRGGFQSIPLEPLHAQEIGNTREASLALNGAYNALFFSLSSKELHSVPIDFPDNAHTRDIVRALYPDSGLQAVGARAPRNYNVIVFLLESWPAAYMKSYGFDKDVTPHFGALRKVSLTTQGMLAGGHRTTEGMFASFCSEQNPLGATVAESPLENFHYTCLPDILRARGYSTAFFQGTHRNTSGTGAFAQLLGFQGSYGKEDIHHRRYTVNHWGVQDPDLYTFIHHKIDAMHQPFLIGINTATTHDLELPDGVKPTFGTATLEERNLNVLHFADWSLARFIKAVRHDPKIGPTLFVVLADHTTIFNQNNFNNYNIPFLIYAPGIVQPRFVHRMVSQRDVAPTVLDLLHLPPAPWFTGKSVLRNDQGPYFADYYNNGILGWIEGSRLIEVPVVDPRRVHCYDYLQDRGQRHPLSCAAADRTMARQGLAFTRVAQDLLFSGHLRRFAALKGKGPRAPRMAHNAAGPAAKPSALPVAASTTSTARQPGAAPH